MSELEETLLGQMRVLRLPEPMREARLVPGRRYRVDFCWPDRMLCLEVQGGTWMQGRHVRPEGYERDAEKENALTLAGWRCLKVTAAMIADGRAVTLVERALQ